MLFALQNAQVAEFISSLILLQMLFFLKPLFEMVNGWYYDIVEGWIL